MPFDLKKQRQLLRKMQDRSVKGGELSRPVQRPGTKGTPITSEAVGEAITSQLAPLMENIRSAIQAINISPSVQAPNVYVPEVRVPTPIVNVTVPEIKIPESKFVMPDMLKVYDTTLSENSAKRPLHMIAVDQGGKPINFGNFSMGASGGKGDFFTIKNIQSSLSAVFTDRAGVPFDGTNPVPVIITSGAGGSTAAALIDSSGVQYSGSNPLPVTLASGALSTTSVVGDGASGVADPDQSYPVKIGGKNSNTQPTFSDGQRGDLQIDTRGNLKVTIVANNASTGQTVLVDNADGVAVSATANGWKVQSRNSIFNGVAGSWDRLYGNGGQVNGGTLRVVHATDVGASVSATQVGNWDIGTVANVTNITNSISAYLTDSSGVGYNGSNPVPVTLVSGAGSTTASALVDSTGVQYSGSNPLPITGPVVVTSITNTIAANAVDSSGVAYSGSNPLPVSATVSGSITSTVSVGDIVSDGVDTGSAPLKVGGIARTANPTAVANGDRVSATYDKLGRGITRPVQVRDLILTAYATSSTGIETTLLTATAGTFADCIMLTATNASSAAVQVDIRATTAGNIIHTFYLPASTGPVGWAPSIPWPQDSSGNTWTFDVAGSDVSGTNVYVSGLFSQEV